MNVKKLIAVAAGLTTKALAAAIAASAAIPMTANAASSITIDSVAQRWPWNNKVDITYTVTDAQNRAAGVYWGIDFNVTANGRHYSLPGNTVGASAETGGSGTKQYTVTWTAPSGIRAVDASITATLYPTNGWASGNDYMIVDLTTGAITYDGLLSTQDDSNARYNVAEFKTTKMVLRKIPKWADKAELPNAADLTGGYPTGDSANFPSGNDANTSTTWATERDYYIGVYPVTQSQYATIGASSGYGSNPSTPSEKTGATTGTNIKEHRPVERVSWNDLRLSTTAATSSIPVVASANTGTFFQRLNFKTGLYFDLPTEVMFEIAERAGATTVYSWGGTTNDLPSYCVYKGNSGNSSWAVGSKLPNNWGLYDTSGNVFEWSLDGKVNGNLASRRDAFSPAWGSVSDDRRLRGGAQWASVESAGSFRASARTYNTPGTRGNFLGFRVSYIVK